MDTLGEGKTTTMAGHSSDETGGSSVRSTSSMSHIPVPQDRGKRMEGRGAGPTGLPQRVPTATSSRGHGSSSASKASSHRPTKASPSLTIPRAPMANVMNRTVSLGRSPSGLQLPKGNTAVGASKLINRRRVSGGREGPTRATTGDKGSDGPDGGRMDAIESRITSMQDLFELERQRTEGLLTRERTERQVQEDKVRQLEQDLLEQRRVAGQGDAASTFQMGEEKRRMVQRHEEERTELQERLEREQRTVSALKLSLSQQSTAQLTMEATTSALRIQIGSLDETVLQLRSQVAQLEKANLTLTGDALELESSLREAESIRRKLHNEVQELRGNIRVFVRVRPSVANDAANGTTTLATIRFPNVREATQIELLATGESATGTAVMKNHQFSFDRIFTPAASQSDVFEEVAHLTQSVLDGYNTCIFAYGQTGSGKTHSLEGPVQVSLAATADPSSDAQAGIIPRAVQMLWKTAKDLREKGWQYSFEGQMLEIYNEGINDLLGRPDSDAKYEVKHEKGRTTVTDAVVVPLENPAQVFTLLAKAKGRRQTATTLMNERSSRSHSIFTVRVRGSNSTTMESCDAVLNLVDLAGSERLSNSGSGSNPIRLKEAQCINKSLSSLADVIAALHQAKQQANGHVPYRNSTLTWLLRNSLGGNAKTLMLLALSPMAEHMNESLCSLRFASKVNNTFIGTARRVGGGGAVA